MAKIDITLEIEYYEDEDYFSIEGITDEFDYDLEILDEDTRFELERVILRKLKHIADDYKAEAQEYEAINNR